MGKEPRTGHKKARRPEPSGLFARPLPRPFPRWSVGTIIAGERGWRAYSELVAFKSANACCRRSTMLTWAARTHTRGS